MDNTCIPGPLNVPRRERANFCASGKGSPGTRQANDQWRGSECLAESQLALLCSIFVLSMVSVTPPGLKGRHFNIGNFQLNFEFPGDERKINI